MDDNPNMCEFRKAGLPIYFLVGGPGSGKATQAARLQCKLGYTIINIGKLLRDEACSGSGNAKLNHTLDTGELAPQDVAMKLLKEALLKSLRARKPILIIGFPRNVCQLQAFEKEISQAKGTFYLDASDCTLKNRQKFRGRADDKPETIEKKLHIFRKQTRPMIEQMINTGRISRIDGEKPTDEVFAELYKALQSQSSCVQANAGCNERENEPGLCAKPVPSPCGPTVASPCGQPVPSPCGQPKRPSGGACGQPPVPPPRRNTCDQPSRDCGR